MTVTRVGAVAPAGITAILTVATSPAAAAGANTVTVTIEPKIAAVVSPAVLRWVVTQPGTKGFTVTNTGDVDLDYAVAKPVPPTIFGWPGANTAAALPARGTPVTVPVTLLAGQSPSKDEVHVAVVPHGGHAADMISGFPATVTLTAIPPAQQQNQALGVPLKITTIVADPPGNDVLPEGEFIELTNTTSAPVELSGLSITHVQFGDDGTHTPGTVIDFGPAAFGTDSLLPPGPILRVLTRAQTAADPAPGPGIGSAPWRVYAGHRVAVWNNTGDTGTVWDQQHRAIDVYTYTPGPLTSSTHYSAVPAPVRTLVTRVWVDVSHDWTDVFMVQDGDLVTFTASGIPSFGGFLGAAGSVGPAGFTNDPAPWNDNWPSVGDPKYGLLAKVGNQLATYIGAGGSITVFGGGPWMLSLGPNDNYVSDNSGSFDCVAVLYRRPD